jgi:hypothetical protein
VILHLYEIHCLIIFSLYGTYFTTLTTILFQETWSVIYTENFECCIQNICRYTLFIWIFLPFCILTVKSDGTLNGAPCQGWKSSWHAKDRFPDVRKRVGSLGAVRETQTFKTKHYILPYRRNMAVILLKGRKTQNQSINWYKTHEISNSPRTFSIFQCAIVTCWLHIVSIENLSLIWIQRRHRSRWGAVKFRPMIGTIFVFSLTGFVIEEFQIPDKQLVYVF